MIADTDKVDERIEMVLLGESGVGKTNIARRFENFEEKFEENHEPTSQLTLYSRKVTINELTLYSREVTINDKIIEFRLWDTPGKESHRNLAKSLFKFANVFILVYDVTNKDSFDKLQKSCWMEWIEEIKENKEEAKCK